MKSTNIVNVAAHGTPEPILEARPQTKTCIWHGTNQGEDKCWNCGRPKHEHASGTVKQGRRPMFRPFSKHTQGPWKQNHDETVERLNCILGADGEVVCDNIYGQGKEQGAANARLIALGPELLEMLSRIVEKAYKNAEMSDYDIHPALIEQAKVILSKA